MMDSLICPKFLFVGVLFKSFFPLLQKKLLEKKKKIELERYHIGRSR